MLEFCICELCGERFYGFSKRIPFKGRNRANNIVCHGGSFNVGSGSLESIYEESLAHEFTLRGIVYERQREISLRYKGKDVGKHRIDYLVENEVIVELKAVEVMNKIYEAQLLTYLRAMNKRVGLLINFNVERLKEGIKRLII